PDDVGIVHKIDLATGKVIGVYTRRGNDANAAGKLGEAGNWWQKAVELCDPLAGYPPEKSAAYKAIDHNQAALEYFGDVAVDVPEIRVDDKGFHGLGSMLQSKLTPHLDDVTPYGPTRDPAAIQATFKATIVSFDKSETKVDGVDHIANEAPPSTTPIDNPAI